MGITIKHYYNFNKAINGDNILICQDGWDSVRLDTEDTPFSIPYSVEAYESKLMKTYAVEANEICDVINENNFHSIFSIGYGCGFLEANIKKKMPDVHVACSDFNPKSVNQLKSVMTYYDELNTFDITKDQFPIKDSQLYLLFRIDTELSDKEWMQAFNRMAEEKVDSILIVATELLTPQRFIKESIKGVLRNIKGYTFCGYIRSKANFKALWDRSYRIEKELKIGSLDAFLLKIDL